MANQTMNNMELSRHVETLLAQYADLNLRFNTAMPEMSNHITQSVDAIKVMHDAIKSEIKPVVDQFEPLKTAVEKLHEDAQNEYQKIQRLGDNTMLKITEIEKSIEDKTKILEASVNAMGDMLRQMGQTFGVDSQSRVEMEVKSDQLGAKIDAMALELEHAKRTQESNYQTTQMQLTTAISSSVSGSGMSSGSGTKEPLATHKLMISETKINGSENSAILDDWFELITMKVNLIYPGGKSILDWSAEHSGEITASDIQSRGDSALAAKLSMEMYVFLKLKTELTAANHLKPISADRGLEAWRKLRRELLGKDGPRQEEEFNAVADLPKLKLADMSNFDNLYVRWESELRKHEVISREYFIGKYRKRQIVYKSLPDEIQKSVDIEVGKNQLQTYEEFIDFIKSISKSNRFRNMPAPKPLSANLIAEEPEAPSYSRNDWIAYLNTAEGWNAYEAGEDVPPDALREVLTLVPEGNPKGKGKGYNPKGNQKGNGTFKGKGKGKGGKAGKGFGKQSYGKGTGTFSGNCNNCGAYGHKAMDCTQPRKNGGFYMVDQYSNAQPSNASCCAFMLTTPEDTVVDYRNPWQSVGKGMIEPSSILQVSDVKPSNPNRFSPLQVTSPLGSSADECAWKRDLVEVPVCHNAEVDFTIPEQHSVPQTKLDMVNFPIPVTDKSFPIRHKMPRMPKVSRQRKTKFGCDADGMSMRELDSILNNNTEQSCCNDPCCAAPSSPVVTEPQASPIEPGHSSRPEVIDPETGQLTCCLDHSCEYCVRDSDDTAPTPVKLEPLSISSIQEIPQDHTQAKSNHQEVSIGSRVEAARMATRMMANMKRKNMEISQTVIDMANLDDPSINLITENPDSAILNLNQKMVWVQVPCAVDSGACANVAPVGIFSLEKSLIKLQPKFFGADGSPIENLGTMVAMGTSEEGVEMKIDFDLAKVTRPLLSVHKMTSNGHKVIFNEEGGYIQVKGSSTRINLRPEGRLFMLDLWVKVPQEVADSSPFVRQVAKE